MLGSLSVIASDKDKIFINTPKSFWVLESENAFVIKDKHPQAPVHLLIIPKKPTRTILDASPELIGEMIQLGNKAAKKYNISDSGFRIVINTNTEGGQHIYHLHMHLLGGRKMNWPPG